MARGTNCVLLAILGQTIFIQMPAEPINQVIPQGGDMPKRRKIKLPENSKINKNIIDELDVFLEVVPAKRLSQSLRDMFLLCLSMDRDVMLGWPFEKMPEDLFFLLQFLDAASEELSEAKAA